MPNYELPKKFRMKENILDLLRGKFLISNQSIKNWRFILLGSLLAMIMIASSHSVDKKIHDIARLNEELKVLQNSYVNTRTQVQQLQTKAYIEKKVKPRGLISPNIMPQKIRVLSEK